MKLIKCPEGHGYDAEKFQSCPLCAKSKPVLKKAKIVKLKPVKRGQPEAKPAPAPEKAETKPVLTDGSASKKSLTEIYQEATK